jgi:hypothetical protein
MSSYEGRDQMDRSTAEQILQGARATLDAGHPRLAGLLSAAGAAGHPAEMAGESAAVAAFTAAHHSPPSPVRRPSMIQLALAKILTVKAAAIAGVACASVGGVALAANAGVLPEPITQHLPGVHSSKSAEPRPTPSGSALPRPSASVSASAAPNDIAVLCRDFRGRGDRAHRSKALDEPRFGELVRRAGKKDHDRVEKFCTRVKPSGSPAPRPSGSAFPVPDGLPSGHPTRPGADPSGRPGEPSGYPSDRPSPFPSGSAEPRPKSRG